MDKFKQDLIEKANAIKKMEKDLLGNQVIDEWNKTLYEKNINFNDEYNEFISEKQNDKS